MDINLQFPLYKFCDWKAEKPRKEFNNENIKMNQKFGPIIAMLNYFFKQITIYHITFLLYSIIFLNLTLFITLFKNAKF